MALLMLTYIVKDTQTICNINESTIFKQLLDRKLIQQNCGKRFYLVLFVPRDLFVRSCDNFSVSRLNVICQKNIYIINFICDLGLLKT